MQFRLRHMPRNGNELIRTGTIYGPFLGSGVMRMHFHSENPTVDSQDLLLVNGSDPEFWTLDTQNTLPQKISLTASLQPLIQGMNQTPFDLLMPFVFWDGEYENSGKVAGRPAHLFSFACPTWMTQKNRDWHKITLALDDTYEAPLRVEVLGKHQIPERTLILRSFKKLGERWIVKEIDCRDRKSRSVTRMKITAVALGLDLENLYFKPSSLNQSMHIDPKFYLTTD